MSINQEQVGQFVAGQSSGAGGINDGLFLDAPSVVTDSLDEFNSGSAVLADRGWILRHQNTGTILTRVGEVVPYEYKWFNGAGTQLTTAQYRSSIRNGRLLLQLCSTADNNYVLVKAFTMPALTTANHGAVVWSRYASTRASDATGLHGHMQVCFMKNTAGAPDDANRLFHELGYSGAATNIVRAGVIGGVYTTRSLGLGDTEPDDMFGIMVTQGGSMFFRGGTHVGAVASGQFESTLTFPNATLIGSGFAGISFWVATTNPHRESDGIRVIDFIRLRTGNMSTLCTSGQWLWP